MLQHSLAEHAAPAELDEVAGSCSNVRLAPVASCMHLHDIDACVPKDGFHAEDGLNAEATLNQATKMQNLRTHSGELNLQSTANKQHVESVRAPCRFCGWV